MKSQYTYDEVFRSVKKIFNYLEFEFLFNDVTQEQILMQKEDFYNEIKNNLEIKLSKTTTILDFLHNPLNHSKTSIKID